MQPVSVPLRFDSQSVEGAEDVVAFGVVAVGGLVGVLRFMTRRRRRW